MQLIEAKNALCISISEVRTVGLLGRYVLDRALCRFRHVLTDGQFWARTLRLFLNSSEVGRSSRSAPAKKKICETFPYSVEPPLPSAWVFRWAATLKYNSFQIPQ
jgi:hypothetical protein